VFGLTLLLALQGSGSRITAELVVPSGADEENPLGRPDDAIRQATIYSNLIPKDDSLSAAIEEATGDEPEISAAVVPNTSLITVRITSEDTETAEAAMSTFLEIVTSDDPVIPSIEPGTLEVVTVDEPTDLASSSIVILVGGLLVGLAMGATAAIVLDRADPLVDDLKDLRALEVPSSRLSGSSTDNIRSLEVRWADEVGAGATVALLPGRGETATLAEDFARVMEAVTPGTGGEDSVVPLAGLGGTDTTSGLNAALEADAVVVLIGQGSRVRALREDLRNLVQIARPPLWIVLLDRGVEADLQNLRSWTAQGTASGAKLETIEPAGYDDSNVERPSRWTRQQPQTDGDDPSEGQVG